MAVGQSSVAIVNPSACRFTALTPQMAPNAKNRTSDTSAHSTQLNDFIL